MKLYSYFRSSASYRVRIALNYKNIPHRQEYVHLVKEGGEQFKADYKKLNSQCLVPTLVDDEHIITQSLAMLEYLEEKYPSPALLPEDIHQRAKVRSMALQIACEIHPLNNLRVLQYLQNDLQLSDEDKSMWYQHWIIEGFNALEVRLERDADVGKCCFGDTPTFADLCLIPQVYNAKRFDCPLDDYPTIMRINDHCLGLTAFATASPESQCDCPGN